MVNEDGWLGLGPIAQLGVVTPDLDAAIASARITSPDASWLGWTYGPDLLAWQRIGASAASYQMRLAISGSNPQLEFVQPLDSSTSLSRKLAADGQSLHHVGIFVSSFEAESARLRAHGIEQLESGGGHGVDGDGAFGYFDTRALFGVIIELIEPCRQRPEPHFAVGREAGTA
jgi:methylmalonyl-CoA/ethylmalonyl-CoA epimerase